MSSLIKHPRDFYAGLMYSAVGLGAIIIARDYNMGTSVRMGPGYFPTMLGGLLVLVGAISMVRSFFNKGEGIPAFSWKEIVLVLGSVVLFGVLVRGAGLVPSLILLVIVSAWASDQFRLKTALLLAVLTSVFSALVFVKGLGLPFAIIGPWFGI
ncbi:tripartite tricarboxylate transporter TctB family protein [Propionivibrio soli]|uniref:tripartite tricarboxylate transporter TctB family protein n=1 Tax=Propionivibrio soli TaxID=2976531 RepID=UPI0021E8F58E|nr:tripartite tricarboxylate transporter TctB family protein [Propionivibrio soli]